MQDRQGCDGIVWIVQGLVASSAIAAACWSVPAFDDDGGGEATQPRTAWHAGNFRRVPSMAGDLESLVAAFEHPHQNGYGKLSASRTSAFTAFVDAVSNAIDDSLADGDTGDWCDVSSRAAAAGYAVRRFYDTPTGRWFVYGSDSTDHGQSYFLLNPYAKRNLVVEVPHAGSESRTDRQGARIFKALAARALLVNKEHRCSDRDPSTCDGTTTQCGGVFKESDVAHHAANTFTVLHQRLASDTRSRFVQLHGMAGRLRPGPRNIAQIGDGTVSETNANSVSVTFATLLGRRVPTRDGIVACQAAGSPPSPVLCGETNMQGRRTNAPAADPCTTGATHSSGRFLHVEQHLTLRDDDDADGYFWGDVRDALRDTWPQCDMNNGAVDCTLGPVQRRYGTLSCPAS